MVQVLLQKVVVDSDKVFTDMQSIQQKRGITKEETNKQKQVKQFQTDISNAIAEIAKMGSPNLFITG